MHRFTTNPPSRQVKPARAYTPTFYDLPDVGRPAAPPRSGKDLAAAFGSYFRRTGIAPSRIGRMLANDPALFSDLRRGREPGAKLRTRMVRFLEVEAAHA